MIAGFRKTGDQLAFSVGTLEPKMLTYLSALLEGAISLPRPAERELQTLVTVINLMVAGKISHAADVVCQRFKATELAQTEGSGGSDMWTIWNYCRPSKSQQRAAGKYPQH